MAALRFEELSFGTRKRAKFPRSMMPCGQAMLTRSSRLPTISCATRKQNGFSRQRLHLPPTKRRKCIGIPGVQGPRLRGSISRIHRRGGLMGIAAIITNTKLSISDKSGARGKWVLEEILGTPPHASAECAETSEDDPPP